MRAFLRGIPAAAVFLTRVPVGGFPYSAAEWRWANAHLPLVGGGVGALAALVWNAAAPLGAWTSAVLSVAATVLLTGAFHEDGLADTADALGGGIESPDRVHEILKDSRIGTYGTVAVVLVLLLRVVLLVELGADAAVALVLSHVLARTPPVAVKAWLPYATVGTAGKSRDLSDSRWREFAVAMGWATLIGIAVAPDPWVLGFSVLTLLVLGLVLAWRFRTRVGGYTGDFLGATEQLGEVVVLMVLVAR